MRVHLIAGEVETLNSEWEVPFCVCHEALASELTELETDLRRIWSTSGVKNFFSRQTVRGFLILLNDRSDPHHGLGCQRRMF